VMIENQNKKGFGLTFQNELVLTQPVDLKKYLLGIYIPVGFNPIDDDEIEDDEFSDEFASDNSTFGQRTPSFNFREYTQQFPEYIFIKDNDKSFKSFIDFKSFQNWTD
jgi:hypothetical protein